MPPKKVKNNKPRESEDDESSLNQLDIQYNPDIILSLLNELAANVELKCSQIQKDSDFLSTSIQQAFHLELIKLPTQVKQMSIKRFKEEFGFSLEAVTRGAINQKKTNKDGSLNNNHTKVNSKVYETPSQRNKYNSNLMATPRNPREGETLLSQNGSPLGEFTTVKKAPKTGGTALCDTNNIIPPTPGMYIPLKNGDIIDIESTDIENLSMDAKTEALQKMQEMMNNMHTMMAKLSKTNTTSSTLNV